MHPLAEKWLYQLKVRYRSIRPKRVIGFYEGSRPVRGRVLISYLPGPLSWRSDDPRFEGHSNLWESAEIGRTFTRLGYVVDAVSEFDTRFRPNREYDVIFDTHKNLTRCSSDRTRKILYSTGSYNRFSNEAENRRLEALRQRRGAVLVPRRQIPAGIVAAFDQSAAVADAILLYGNQCVRSTFPAEIQSKIVCLPGTGSAVRAAHDAAAGEADGTEFLWFGGVGAVHKGLDLVLEAFAKMPESIFHVVGPYELEDDFVQAYWRELKHCRNIIGHGYLYPASERFRQATRNVSAFIFPSCSEGTSTAAITCLEQGFIPIVSSAAGLDVTSEIGITLRDCSVEEIILSVRRIASLKKAERKNMGVAAQIYARENFSRENFSRKLEASFRAIL